MFAFLWVCFENGLVGGVLGNGDGVVEWGEVRRSTKVGWGKMCAVVGNREVNYWWRERGLIELVIWA